MNPGSHEGETEVIQVCKVQLKIKITFYEISCE